MSASDGNQADSHAGTHDAHGHAAPAPLPEPHTPMWLPAVGALLFLMVGLFWALSSDPKDKTDLSAIPAGSAAAPATGAAPKAAPAH